MQDCPGQGWETGLQRGLQQGPKERVQAGTLYSDWIQSRDCVQDCDWTTMY